MVDGHGNIGWARFNRCWFVGRSVTDRLYLSYSPWRLGRMLRAGDRSHGIRRESRWNLGELDGCWRGCGSPDALYLQYELRPTDTQRFLRGELDGTAGFSQITLWAHGPMFVTQQKPGLNFRFSVFDDDIQAESQFQITLVKPKPDDTETTIKCLDTALLKKDLGKSQIVLWTVKPDSQGNLQLFDEENSPHGQVSDQCDPANSVPIHPALRDNSGDLMRALARLEGEVLEYLVPSVNAQNASPFHATIQDLIAALNSENSDQRQAARIGLSEQNGIAALRTMAAAWDITKSSYRLDLGLLVAWTEAIHTKDRGTAVRLLETLSAGQVAHLLVLAGHHDQTMRDNATALIALMLKATGSPANLAKVESDRFLNIILDVLRHPQAPSGVDTETTSHQTIVYNTLVAIDFAQCGLVPSARQEVQQTLSSFRPDGLSRTDPMRAKISTLAASIPVDATSCPATSEPGRVTVSVFLKRNLTANAVPKLKAALPNYYDIRTEAGMGTAYDADTLFVDRDWVPVDSVVKVLRALEEQGVTIKYVQQLLLRRSEIQIGTVVLGEEPIFETWRASRCRENFAS